jgi:hypothetical protein
MCKARAFASLVAYTALFSNGDEQGEGPIVHSVAPATILAWIIGLGLLLLAIGPRFRTYGEGEGPSSCTAATSFLGLPV